MSMNGQGLRGLIGRDIKVNRGGPDAIQGTLMDVRWDYMAMGCKEGIVYVNESHVKSITDTGRSGGVRGAVGNPIPSNTFLGVMQALRFRHVQINRGGPEKVAGILAEANQSQLILTMKNHEIIRIPLQHVKSVSIVRGNNNNNNNNSNNTNNSNNNNNNNNNNTSQGNRTQNNQSGGNRSQGNRNAANQSQGNKSQGNKGQGNKSQGNKAQGNKSNGNRSSNNKSRGNQSQGNQSRGNKSQGHKSQGNQSRGNKSGGKR